MIRRHHIPNWAVAAFVILALIVGGFVSRNLHLGSASVKSSAGTALAQTYGDLQAKSKAAGNGYPFLGPYHYDSKKLECGPGIRLMEGALAHLPKPVRKGKPALCFGKATRAEIIVFQKRLHYKPTGVYTLAVHQQLVKRHGYSATAREGLLFIVQKNAIRAHAVLVGKERRTVQIVAAHVALVGGRTLTYSQSSSRSYFPAYPRIPPATDCSGMATYILYQAGVGASVGYFGPGSPVGWTGTLRYQGTPVPRGATLEPGDLIFYGEAPNWSHVAVYIGRGLVVSHGQTGVDEPPYNYRTVGEIRRYIS
jgi:cell wall-associated NlpC family hydrolase